ncbi:hypothetical protein N7513_006407 [Penicillium frequentans]|nr:hypothetical protein N7513_006407 [Penicillium glabrum]
MMAQAKLSENLENIHVAELPIISYENLLSKDKAELGKLLESCKSLGFFYLDLTGSARSVLENTQAAFEFMKTYFDQSLEDKSRDLRQSVTHGYTPTGTYTGAKRGERDCYETLKIAEAEMRVRAPQLPSAVQEKMAFFEDFISGSHSVVLKILECLSDVMSLDVDERFEGRHRPDQPSRTTMVLFRYPRQIKQGEGIGHNMHTDIGSLTLLFCQELGLQVLHPETNQWGFIIPKPGHAVVNVGDSLRFLSGHRLASCVHRVLPVTERQESHRYSIAYFLRPEDDTMYVDSKERVVSARAWHDEKYGVFREPHEMQEADMILTGGMEHNGVYLCREKLSHPVFE